MLDVWGSKNSHIVRNNNIYPCSDCHGSIEKVGPCKMIFLRTSLGHFPLNHGGGRASGIHIDVLPRQPAGAARREWGNESQLHDYGSNLGCQFCFHIFENMFGIPIIQLLGVFSISSRIHNGITKFIQYPLGHHHDSLHIQFIQ